ncbi:MAG TPA: cupredoxin domain-containing protein [Rhodoblastus sp.]|nr:cupredoxin domain-containing protein [Rhodoblastus sp.]
MRSVGLLCLLLLSAAPARAGETPTFRIEFNDGKFEPHRLEVPANTRIEIELVNKGQGPAEFESKQLRKEKVIAPGATTSMVIRDLDPGEYDFFDDFHPDAPPAVLVAK